MAVFWTYDVDKHFNIKLNIDIQAKDSMIRLSSDTNLKTSRITLTIIIQQEE